MSNYCTIDRESFQEILATAFAVQQGQLDKRLLSAIVEVGRLTMSGKVDVDEAVQLVVDRTEAVNTPAPAIGSFGGNQLPWPELDEDARSSGAFLSHLASTLAAPDIGVASAEMALDLALNDIAKQACSATNASVAAVALMRGEEIICRATAGKSSRELAELLRAQPGLFAECVNTKQRQCCSDTETDSRIDPDACQRLGIRSWLVVPVLNQGELFGLFAIFSPGPKAFGDGDIRILETLSRQILISVNQAAELSTPARLDYPSNSDTTDPAPSVSFQERTTEVKGGHFQLNDPLLLAILAILLALLLGWMLGRVRERTTADKHQRRVPAQVSAKRETALPQPEETGGAEVSPPPANSPSDALVVYQGKKVIFRLKPSQVYSESSATNPELLYPRKTSVQLLQRVEPEYPEAAKQQHIQGAVVLDAKVGEDGIVQQLDVISGDSTLATAASDAVLKWRFKPVVQNGRATSFQTRVIVNFVLP